MASINLLDIYMLSHKGMTFERIRRCGLVGESESLVVSLEVSKAHDKPRVSLSILRVRIRLLTISLALHLPTSILTPVMPRGIIIVVQTSETVSKAPIKCFLL